ncbi:MAG: ATP-binding protein [Gemmataceae bacterium]
MSAATTQHNSATAPILVVEANSDLRDNVCRVINELGWATSQAHDPASALAAIQSDRPQIILTDLGLAGGGAFAFLEQLRREAPNVPVIILMSAGFEAATLRALQRGAAGYASAENFADELPEILERVISAAQSTRDRRRLQSSVTRMEMNFLLENDTALVPVLVAEVQDYLAWINFLDRPARVRLGVALEEALLNAIIHGNLEISSALRQQNEKEYRQAIEERRHKAPYRDRKVRFAVRLRAGRAIFNVADRGPGFDPESLPDPCDPSNLERVGGRGLLLIRTFMDEVKFNRKGSRITMLKFDKNAQVPVRQGRSSERKTME